MTFVSEAFETPREPSPEEAPPALVDHLLALSLPAQLGVLRTVVPKVLSRLRPEQRQGFMRDLDQELGHVTLGEESYDIRSRGVTASLAGESRRHEARASATYAKFLGRLAEVAGLPSGGAERIAVSALCLLKHRLIAGEAADLESQLPSRLRELLARYDYGADFRPRDLDGARFTELISDDLGVSHTEAELFTRAVFLVLSEHVSSGEIEQVRHLLPADLRRLWPA